jgi:hypothetical protein
MVYWFSSANIFWLLCTIFFFRGCRLSFTLCQVIIFFFFVMFVEYRGSSISLVQIKAFSLCFFFFSFCLCTDQSFFFFFFKCSCVPTVLGYYLTLICLYLCFFNMKSVLACEMNVPHMCFFFFVFMNDFYICVCFSL